MNFWRKPCVLETRGDRYKCAVLVQSEKQSWCQLAEATRSMALSSAPSLSLDLAASQSSRAKAGPSVHEEKILPGEQSRCGYLRRSTGVVRRFSMV
jgi:hypothetical protein